MLAHRDLHPLAGAALLALVAGALFFFGLGHYALWDPDEARHAEVAREMFAAPGLRHAFLPTLEWQPYREKPAGYYWLVALAFRMAGVGEAPARAVNALAALLTVLALYVYALPRAGAAGALAAGFVLATSVGWFGLARYGNLDMTLTACVTIGVLAGLAWLERPAPRRPPFAPYIAAGLGTLVKGPLAVALVGGPLALAILSRRPRPAARELGLGRGIVLMLAIIAILYVPMAVLDASYLTHFGATNLRRFTPESPHREPFYYYLLWLPALMLPWTLVAVPALVRAARDPHRRALLLWAGFVPALFTLAEGKLATYVLPALPPLALLLGPEMLRLARDGPEAGERVGLLAGGWIAAVALAAGAGASLLAAPAYPIPGPGRAALAGAAFAWLALLAVVLRYQRLRLLPAMVLGGALTIYPLAVRFVAPAVSALHSDREAAALIARVGPAPVIAFAVQNPSLAFYLQTPLIHTDDPRLVRDLFAAEGHVFLVTRHRHFAEVERLLGADAHRWHTTARRRLYGNRPPPPGVVSSG